MSDSTKHNVKLWYDILPFPECRKFSVAPKILTIVTMNILRVQKRYFYGQFFLNFEKSLLHLLRVNESYSSNNQCAKLSTNDLINFGVDVGSPLTCRPHPYLFIPSPPSTHLFFHNRLLWKTSMSINKLKFKCYDVKDSSNNRRASLALNWLYHPSIRTHSTCVYE